MPDVGLAPLLLAVRGTALALSGRLDDAIADFTAAIKIDDSQSDFFKRRYAPSVSWCVVL